MGRHRRFILAKKLLKEKKKPELKISVQSTKEESVIILKSECIPIKNLNDFNYSVNDILNNPIYVVNLDQTKWDFMEWQLKNAGFKNPIRFPAINGHKYENSENMSRLSTALNISFRGKKELRGNRGASLSQIFLYYQALKDDVDYIYIMEDDSVFCDNFKTEFEKFLEKTPKDFDILYIGSQPDFNRGCNKIYSFTSSEYIAQVPSFCLHNYIITKKGILKYLNEIKKLGYSSLDCDLINWCQQGKFIHYQLILNKNYKFNCDVHIPRSYGLVGQSKDFSVPKITIEESPTDTIICECGSSFQRKNLVKHLATKKHYNNINTF